MLMLFLYQMCRFKCNGRIMGHQSATIATKHDKATHDDLIKWKHFLRYWPFVRRIHQSPVNSPHKGQWRGALVFSLICTRINGRVNNGEAGDLRRHEFPFDGVIMNHEGCGGVVGVGVGWVKYLNLLNISYLCLQFLVHQFHQWSTFMNVPYDFHMTSLAIWISYGRFISDRQSLWVPLRDVT